MEKKGKSQQGKETIILKTWVFWNWKIQYLQFKIDWMSLSVQMTQKFVNLMINQEKLSNLQNRKKDLKKNRDTENCETESKCLIFMGCLDGSV